MGGEDKFLAAQLEFGSNSHGKLFGLLEFSIIHTLYQISTSNSLCEFA